MVLTTELVLLVHLLGFAALFGGFLVQVRLPEPDINAAMLYGAWLALLSGAALLVFAYRGADPVYLPPLVVKGVLTVLVVVLVTANRRYATVPRGLLQLLGLMTLAATAISVLWR